VLGKPDHCPDGLKGRLTDLREIIGLRIKIRMNKLTSYVVAPRISIRNGRRWTGSAVEAYDFSRKPIFDYAGSV
jgi:hypothetical protein